MTDTLIIIIIDESGSMGGQSKDVLGGFNGFIENQKKITKNNARLYLVKFNTVVSVVHSGLELKNVPELTNETYTPGGGTALFDAIAEGVRLADKDKKAEERVICVIMTDGEENSSRETTKQQIKDIISGYEAKGDWTFLYIGENPERWAKETGMSARRTKGGGGAQMDFRCLGAAVTRYRAWEDQNEPVDWSKVQADYNRPAGPDSEKHPA